MIHWLIIGIGNPLREDDGVGWAAAERLAALTLPGVALRVETAHQLLPEMAEWLAEMDGVVVVDAAVRGVPAVRGEPGTIAVQRVLPNGSAALLTGHHITPEALAGQALALYGRCAPLHVVTVAAEALGFGTTLSPAVAAALPGVVAQVAALMG